MADQRKSIFTLFPNYESKLGDWVTEKRENEPSNVTITNLVVKDGKSIDTLNKQIIAEVTLSGNGYIKVEITIDGKTYPASFNNSLTTPIIYSADVIVTFKTVVALEETFKITAVVTDLSTNKVTDTKTINVKINADGTVGEANKNLEKQNINSKCFCFSQGLVNFDCSGTGVSISDEMYEKLADDINVDEGILFAIAKQETKKESFIQLSPKKATILLERHYVYNLLKKKFGSNKANECQKEDSTLCNSKVTEKGGYGKSKEQLDRLEKVKKWDNDIAVKSCSWGKFQVMGVYIEKIKLYKDADEFEKAMNLCEVQHFQFFKSYLIDVIGDNIIKAMRGKNWEKIAELYNGKNWKKTNPDYATNLKKYYEEYNN